MSVRFGNTYQHVRETIRRSETDADFTRACRASALSEVLHRASLRSRHYARLFGKYGPSFDVKRSVLDQLQSLPILSKQEIIASPEDFLVAEPGKYDVRTTSGSSGRPPAKVFLDRDRSVREMAFLHHLWSRIGYRLGDGRAILSDYAGLAPVGAKTWRFDRALRELWLSPYNLSEVEMDRYLNLLKRYEVHFLYGVPSALTILALQARRRGWQPPSSLRGVITASESLFAHQRNTISQSFGQIPVLAYYGMSERVGIAGELPGQPDTYEFEPLYGAAELVDDAGQPVSRIGERGRIVCTGFFNKAMALIRYDTGDHAELVEPALHENCYRLQVRGIRSRWNQEYIIGANGEKISIINLDLENYFGVYSEYRYIQTTPGKAVLQVVPCRGASEAAITDVVTQIRRRVPNVVEIDLEVVEALAPGPRGKRRLVDQRIAEMV
jgi:phenylacetate-CoA ligase